MDVVKLREYQPFRERHVAVVWRRDLLLRESADVGREAAVHGCSLIAKRTGLKQSLEINAFSAWDSENTISKSRDLEITRYYISSKRHTY